jgi:hypothetical protein
MLTSVDVTLGYDLRLRCVPMSDLQQPRPAKLTLLADGHDFTEYPCQFLSADSLVLDLLKLLYAISGKEEHNWTPKSF